MKPILSPSFYLCRSKVRFHTPTFEIYAGSTIEICTLSDKFAYLNSGATELCGSIQSEYADDFDILSVFCR